MNGTFYGRNGLGMGNDGILPNSILRSFEGLKARVDLAN